MCCFLLTSHLACLSDCSSKKEMIRTLQKPLAALPRPPHFHHAVYASLPSHQPQKTVLCPITRFSKANLQGHQKQEVTDTVLLMNYPKSQVFHKEVCSENINVEEDGDSLADVLSLASSDVGYLDENHNETIENSDVEVIKVKLKCLGEVQNSLITCIKNNNTLTNDQVFSTNGSSVSDANSFNMDQECSLPSENCDNTVICLKLDKGGQDSSLNYSSVCVTKLDDADLACQSLNHMESTAQLSILSAPEEQACSDVEGSRDVEENIPFRPPLTIYDEDVDLMDVNLHEPDRDIKKESNSKKSEEILAIICKENIIEQEICSGLSVFNAVGKMEECNVADSSNSVTQAELLAITSFTNVDETFQADNNTVRRADNIPSFDLNHSSQIDSGDNPLMPYCAESSKPSSPPSFVVKGEIEERNGLSECLEPHLKSLTGHDTVLCIGANEKVDMFSILSVSPVKDNVMVSGLVEELVVTKRSDSGSFGTKEELDSNENCFEIPYIPTPTDTPYDRETIEFNYNFTSDDDIPDFHDVSRSNMELMDDYCSVNSPRPSHSSLTSVTRYDLSLESKVSDDSEQSIPNGAGETLYDPSETCSEEFYSPLSTFCSPAFASDSGEDFYSPYPDGQANESEPEEDVDDDALWSTLDESDIEIDCNSFSRSVSKPSSPTMHCERKDLDDNDVSSLDGTGVWNGDRWPTFIAYAHQTEEGMRAPLCGNNDERGLSSDSESQDDLSTIYAGDVSPEQSFSCELENESKRRGALCRFSNSTPNMDSVGTYLSSPLELGRLFTLKNNRSASETRLLLLSDCS